MLLPHEEQIREISKESISFVYFRAEGAHGGRTRNKNMTKKDKKQHKLDEDIEMVVEENTSTRKRKRHSQPDTSFETSEVSNEQTVIEESSLKKSKKKKSKSKSEPEDEMVVEENISTKKRKRHSQPDTSFETSEVSNEQTVIEESSLKKSKKKKSKSKSEPEDEMVVEENISTKKRKGHSQADTLLETSQVSNEGTVIEESSYKKSKKKKSKSKLEQEDVPTVEPEQSPPQKKSKKDKKKKSGEESLGVVDTHILKQAKINLGLNVVDPVDEEHSKQEKKKKKKKDKIAQIMSSSEASSERSRNERAMEYLKLWQADKKVWKFNKMMQVQLLHIMYDKSLLTDEDFETLLLYLDGLKGKGREKTMEDAKKILDKEETEVAADTVREGRARQVFQMLA